MNLNIQAIITSYNRPETVLHLIECLQVSEMISGIIVVDSGNNNFPVIESVEVLKSSHKNQPYQRYVGYRASKSDWLLFLDDDMEPQNGWDRELTNLIETKGKKYGMFAIAFEDKHAQGYLKKVEKSVFHAANKKDFFLNQLRWITGYPVLQDGLYTANGVKGNFPPMGGKVQHISGGAFLARRDVLYANFNMQLFYLYDKRMGKGEDGILGYSCSKLTDIYYNPKVIFLHNDKGNSVYTQNDFQYNKLVSYSRAYLSLEYFRINSRPLILGRISFLNYSFWRIIGMIINLALNPNKRGWIGLRGYLRGSWSGLFMLFSRNIIANNDFWAQEAEKDLQESK